MGLISEQARDQYKERAKENARLHDEGLRTFSENDLPKLIERVRTAADKEFAKNGFVDRLAITGMAPPNDRVTRYECADILVATLKDIVSVPDVKVCYDSEHDRERPWIYVTFSPPLT